jgi:hypothetical protein
MVRFRGDWVFPWGLQIGWLVVVWHDLWEDKWGLWFEKDYDICLPRARAVAKLKRDVGVR